MVEGLVVKVGRVSEIYMADKISIPTLEQIFKKRTPDN